MLLLIVQFTSRFHDAFVQNNVSMAIMILIEEKSSVSLTDRLDEVVIKAGLNLLFLSFQICFAILQDSLLQRRTFLTDVN